MPSRRRHPRCVVAAAAMILGTVTAPHQAATATARFDPRSLRGGMAGKPTQIMVLGSAHLSHMPANYRSAYLAPLLDRLAAYRPQVITIEAIAGPDCEYLQRYKAVAPGSADDYCWTIEDAAKATGLDMVAATAAVERTLRAWPQRPTGGDRRRLAALFLAANDRPSAVVQWLRLGIAERRAGDGLDAALTALLTKVAASPNENIAIGATLAARLGLERVHSIDDHSADTVVALLGPGYEAALRRLWSAPNPVHDGFTERANGVGDGRSLLAFYRFLNDPRSGQAAVRSDMGRALRQQTPELFGRKYVAWWETRNLRMVANIRAACGDLPGTRVLSIVGSTHKPYFEAYLGMMSDTVVVKTDPLFRN